MFCGTPDNLNTKTSHSYLWKNKILRYSLTNFCPNLSKVGTHQQIHTAFSVWESVCVLTFQDV